MGSSWILGGHGKSLISVSGRRIKWSLPVFLDFFFARHKLKIEINPNTFSVDPRSKDTKLELLFSLARYHKIYQLVSV